MKNIHLIPTDKPSRLFIDIDDNKLKITQPIGGEYMMNQHIYITSNEEIKEGVNQWYLDKVLNEPYNSGGAQYSSKQDVIILTTDMDLIQDGIQPIDDDFLEWFVENPNCGYVDQRLIWDEEKLTSIYKIVYAFSEPLQELERGITITHVDKQETIEEAGVAYAKTVNENHTSHMLGFHNGAKWQQEKMYEIMDLYADDVMGGCTLRAKEWFEQYKNK
jgi:hypothetical protein